MLCYISCWTQCMSSLDVASVELYTRRDWIRPHFRSPCNNERCREINNPAGSMTGVNVCIYYAAARSVCNFKDLRVAGAAAGAASGAAAHAAAHAAMPVLAHIEDSSSITRQPHRKHYSQNNWGASNSYRGDIARIGRSGNASSRQQHHQPCTRPAPPNTTTGHQHNGGRSAACPLIRILWQSW